MIFDKYQILRDIADEKMSMHLSSIEFSSYWSLQSILAMFLEWNWFSSILVNFHQFWIDFDQFLSILVDFWQFLSILVNFWQFLSILVDFGQFSQTVFLLNYNRENWSKPFKINFERFWLTKNCSKLILVDFEWIFVNFGWFLSILINFEQFFHCQDWLQRSVNERANHLRSTRKIMSLQKKK